MKWFNVVVHTINLNVFIPSYSLAGEGDQMPHVVKSAWLKSILAEKRGKKKKKKKNCVFSILKFLFYIDQCSQSYRIFHLVDRWSSMESRLTLHSSVPSLMLRDWKSFELLQMETVSLGLLTMSIFYISHSWLRPWLSLLFSFHHRHKHAQKVEYY